MKVSRGLKRVSKIGLLVLVLCLAACSEDLERKPASSFKTSSMHIAGDSGGKPDYSKWVFARTERSGVQVSNDTISIAIQDSVTHAPPGSTVRWRIDSYTDSLGLGNPYPIVGTYAGVVDGSGNLSYSGQVSCAGAVSCQYVITVSIDGFGSRTVNFHIQAPASSGSNGESSRSATSSPAGSLWSFARSQTGGTFLGNAQIGVNFTDSVVNAPAGATVKWKIDSYSDSLGLANPYPTNGAYPIVADAVGKLSYSGRVYCAGAVPCRYQITAFIDGHGSRTISFFIQAPTYTNTNSTSGGTTTSSQSTAQSTQQASQQVTVRPTSTSPPAIDYTKWVATTSNSQSNGRGVWTSRITGAQPSSTGSMTFIGWTINGVSQESGVGNGYSFTVLLDGTYKWGGIDSSCPVGAYCNYNWTINLNGMSKPFNYSVSP